jgi:rfaE bifunctional protein nucleotidyltransferase chain/domain/rfaE bifunctional protein kinase chain/domain
VSSASSPIVVVGDALLDVDVLARAERLMPEAPVPVLEERDRRVRPGGAALAATLAARVTGRPVTLVAGVADDADGAQLRAALPPEVQLRAIPSRGSTPVKTRLRAKGQTIARLDRGCGELALTGLPEGIAALVRDAAAVLVSDYGAGVTRFAPLREVLAERAARRPVVWDPHPRGAAPVPGVGLVTPNAGEAAAASGIAGDSIQARRRQAEQLRTRWAARAVAVTLGGYGALLCDGDGGAELFPTDPVSGQDTCGAGDCFAAAATLALAEHGLASEAVAAGVAAASRFVAAGGAASALDERSGTPAPGQSAAELASAVRARGGTVIATGGCFDLLHPGHIATLAAARALGDCLIVCVNSDDSVRRLKGAGRPLQPVEDRVRVLRGLRDVDAVAVFEEDTPSEVLRILQPHVWVKGGDYRAAELPEAGLVRSWGGEVVTVPYLAGRSTSQLVGLARR